MRPKPLHIEPPALKTAERLTPLQLNSFRFGVKHTILTPELLGRLAGASGKKEGVIKQNGG